MDDSINVDVGALTFAVKDGKTYVTVAGKDEEEFGDFTLRFVSELTAEGHASEGYWIGQCGCLINRRYVAREVVLRTSCFDSKRKFINALRQTFQGGTFSLYPACTDRVVLEYYQYLKKDYQAGEQGQCHLMTHIGYQSDGYWCLSDEIQIKDGVLVPAENREYRCADKTDLKLFKNTLEKKLLSEGYLRDTIHRFISLASCWGVNKGPFVAAAAFICQHLMKKGQAVDDAEQANLGMIFSPQKSVGKSLSAKMLAYAQGVPGLKHNQLLAGGDQVMSGVSSKMLLEALTKTTFVIVVDDAKMSNSLSEFLLQVQGGLMQGSAQAGVDSPLGSLLLTSNIKENERLNGRVIHFVYKKESDFSAQKENSIQELSRLVSDNRGFLTVWAMKYADIFTSMSQQGDLLGKLMDVLVFTIPEQQARWYKGVASVLLAHAMLYMSCGMLVECEQLVELVSFYITHYKACTSSPSRKEPTVIEKLEETIKMECSEEASKEKVKTWLNLTVKVNQNGTMAKGLAIKSSHLANWPHIGRQELVDEACKHGKSVVNISVPFAPTAPGETKSKKAIKLPLSLFKQAILDIALNACSGTENAQDDNGEPAEEEHQQAADSDEDELGLSSPLNEDQLQSIKAVYLSMACDLPLLRLSDLPDSDSDPEINSLTESTNLMTPASRRVMHALTPRRRKAFEMGYTAGAKKRINLERSDEQKRKEEGETGEGNHECDVVNENRDTDMEEADRSGEDNHESDVVNANRDTDIVEAQSASTNEEEIEETDKQSVSGCVGVKKTKKVADKETCKLCTMRSPPGTKKKNKKEILWVECDTCDGWFHLSCSGLRRKPSKKAQWHCGNCKKK